MVRACDSGGDGASRRISLLPQRSAAGQKLSKTKLIAEQPESKTETTKISSRKTSGSSVAQHQPNRPTVMPPPPKPGIPHFVPEPAKTPSLRTPSTNRPPSANSSKASARLRTSSVGPKTSSASQASYHGRSVSHQVDRSSMSAASSSRLTLNQHPSTRSQRPAFTAMQQSFTSKEPINLRSLSPPRPPRHPASKDAIPSIDCFHLQMELAQLHLLHRSAHVVQRQWEHSARGILHKRFNALLERHTELKEIADQQQVLMNQLALVHWSQETPAAQIADKVGILSQNIADVCSLLDAGGKYARILEVFQSWFARALQIREQRKLGSGIGEATLNLIEGIGDGWKAEAMVLERELTYCSREIKTFGSIPPSSSLGRVRSLYSKLVLNLVEELDAIQWIENEISIQETAWVDSTIQRLALDVDNDIESVTRH